MMTKKPQMLAAKGEVEKEKGKERQAASASRVAKKDISRRIAPTGGTCRRPSGALVGTLWRFRRVKQRVKARTRAMEAKARVKARTSSSAKVKAKVWVLWITQTRSRTGRRNLGAPKMAHGTRSQPCPRCNVSGVPCPVVPAAVNGQSTMKNMSKMHTTAENTNEVEKDGTNIEKEKKKVENMFAERGWTVKISRKRMKSLKVAKVSRSGCTISELRQKKDERSGKLADVVRRNSGVVKANLIAGLTVKQDALRTKLFWAVDSGACESVVDAAEQVLGYEVQETRSSRSGLAYASAAGEDIPNLGEVFLPMMTKENTKGP